MSVSQRKDGRWLVKYKDPINGKWLQKAFRDEVSARTFNDEVEYEKSENKRLTLRECVVLFVQNVTHCEKTVRCYSFLVNGYDRKNGSHTEGPAEFLADKYCDELDRRDLENLRHALRDRGQCIGTVNQNVSRLKAAMAWAADQDLLRELPWAKYRALPGHKVKHHEGTLEDFLKLYAVLPLWMQWACRTCMALCLRPGLPELCELQWSAFDWQGGFVTVHMGKVGRAKTVFPPEEYLAEAWTRCQEAQARGQIYVCPGGRGHMMNPTSFMVTWSKARAKVDVRLPPYAMRHIAASQMLYSGADIAAVAAQLGHSSPATTAAFYTHAIAAGQKRAAMGLPMVHLVQLVQKSENKNK